jgi:hypothetical protein
MAYALIGAIIALAFLGRIHDRQLEKNGFIKPRDD